MYNLYIYSHNRTVLLTQLSYKDCLTHLVKQNVKSNFKIKEVQS